MPTDVEGMLVGRGNHDEIVEAMTPKSRGVEHGIHRLTTTGWCGSMI